MELKWVGKENVVNHHLDVPYHILEKKWTFDATKSGEAESLPLQKKSELSDSGNMIIHGDNLLALKSLLPKYEGKVKCIYIDPPYNTGNEGWCYNDNVNDPRIKKWFGEVVGKEGEDFTRHDKWLCMMYPRLKLLQKLLAEDGMIFISIDDNEQAHLRLICDEIFGVGNFLANIAWEKRYTRSNNAKRFYSLKDAILCYRKSSVLAVVKEARTEKADSNYSNPDNDPRGPWMTSSYVNPATKEKRKNLVYEIVAPDGRIVAHPTHAWKYSKEEHLRHVSESRLWWGNDGKALYPRLKNFKSEMPRMVPVDLWKYQDVGTTDDGGNTLKQIFGTMIFDTPKPPLLIERMLKMIPDENAIVLDSFAGSGTTAHAVMNLNKQDGGNRKFILVELGDYAENVTAERVKRVIDGYGDGEKAVEGTGGSFSYYELGEPLMQGELLNPKAGETAIREFVWYSETKTAMGENCRRGDDSTGERTYLGTNNGTAYYFFYEPDKVTELNRATVRRVKHEADDYIVYADVCALSAAELKRRHITFKKIPRDIASK